MKRTACLVLVCASMLTIASTASAVTLQVGPRRRYTTLDAVAALVRPGDVVEVDGGATYAPVRFSAAGAAGMPITIRGLRVGGARPVVAGGANTVEIAGDHYVFEGFEVRDGTRRCLYHHAHDVVVRDVVVHDCPGQGIQGSDQDSGSLLLEYAEVYRCGAGTQAHQIYMATDEVAHPGAVFRMQFCYLHDGTGGNAVKSRAERNEVYSNWIEGTPYHALELIGPDPAGARTGWSEALVREDSDVVGNVLRAAGTFFVVRVGGDGTGQSQGRYRFVNNTFVTNAGGSAVMRVFTGIESIEMHDNVFWATGGAVTLGRTVEAVWRGAEVFEGDNNWVLSGATGIPRGFRGTILGTAPRFVGAAAFDYRPDVGSPLIDRGVMTTVSPAGHPFTAPLGAPRFLPPPRTLLAPGTAAPRPAVGAIDLGAYEYAPASPLDASTDASDAAADVRDDVRDAAGDVGVLSVDAPLDVTPDAARPPAESGDGCACAAGREGHRASAAWGALFVVAALASRTGLRRRRRAV